MGRRVSQMNYSSVGTRGVVELSRGSMDALEDYISWCENVARKKLPWAEDMLTMLMAMVAGGIAQKYSAGIKRDPRDSSRAWKMPVPRITNRYFIGWRVERLTRGAWVLTNDSREAYFIEYGIHRNPRTGQVAPRRIRRPIFKLTFLRTMEAMRSTSLSHRIWSDILVPRPGEPGRRTSQLTWFSQPAGVLGPHPTPVGVSPVGAIYKYGSVPQ